MADDDNEDTSGQLIVFKDAPLPSLSINDLFGLPKFADSISFRIKDELLFEIRADGRIIKGSAFTTDDEMSLKFWELIMENFNLAWWRGLVKHR